MIRPLTIATFLTACASGLYLYQSKHEAQVLDRTIEKALHDTAAYREQSRLLAAEWTMLNDPESLRRFSDTYLALKTIAPSQFTSLTDLDGRLPAVPVAAPKGDEDAEPGEPVAAAPEAVPLSPGTAENAPTLAENDDPGRVPARAVAPAAVASVAAAARPAERKIVASRSLAAGAATIPVASDAAPAARAVASSEPRPVDQHPAEARVADRRVAQPAETHVSDPRAAETRAPVAGAQPRPMIVAAASRPAPAVTPALPASASVPAAIPAPVPAARGGSLLGMARGSVASPLPRPMPVSATQWSNAN